MVRLGTYLSLLVSGLTFWVLELLLNYRDYVSNDPFGLGADYQKAYVAHSSQLVFAELFFPLAMALAFLLMLIFKFAAKPVRTTLILMCFISMEFWMWRAYIFTGRMAVLYLQDEANDPTLALPDYFREYMFVFAAAFLLVMLLKEYPPGEDADELNEKLKRAVTKQTPGID